MGTLRVGRGFFKIDLLSALKESKPGDELVLDAGEYHQGIQIQDLTLRAASSQRPHIIGPVSVNRKAQFDGIAFSNGSGNALSFAANTAGSVKHCEFLRCGEFPALWLSGGAQIKLDDTEFHDLSSHGMGLVKGARADLRDCRFVNCGGSGIVLQDQGTSALMERIEVSECAQSGIWLEKGAQLTLIDSRVACRSKTAILLTNGARATLKKIEARSEGGNAVGIRSGSRLEASRGTFRRGAQFPAIFAEGQGTEAAFEHCASVMCEEGATGRSAAACAADHSQIRFISFRFQDSAGAAISLAGGARAVVSKSEVIRCASLAWVEAGADLRWQSDGKTPDEASGAGLPGIGLTVTGKGSKADCSSLSLGWANVREAAQLRLQDCIIRNPAPGNALGVQSGKVEAAACRFEGMNFPALAMEGKDGGAVFRNCVFAGNNLVRGGAQATFEHCRFEREGENNAITAEDGGTVVRLKNCRLEAGSGPVGANEARLEVEGISLYGFTGWREAFLRGASGVIDIRGKMELNGQTVQYENLNPRPASSETPRSFAAQPKTAKPQSSAPRPAQAEAAKAPAPQADSAALAELHALPGLEAVKAEMSRLVNLVKARNRRLEQNLPVAPVSLHLVFMGNPGTGKTTVARLVARIYKDLGLLKKGELIEADRSHLVEGYVGQTATKTAKVLERALDSVLFIDEAYTLAPDKKGGNKDFGQEAIDTLLKVMEDERDRIAVIVAGYTEPIRKFIVSNPGLESRFTRYLHFEDYDVGTLCDIFGQQCAQYRYRLTPEADEFARREIAELHRTRQENFSNARAIRPLFEAVIERQSERIANDPKSDASLITGEDIPRSSIATPEEIEALLAELRALTGLEEVKREIASIVDSAQARQRRREQGLPVPALPLHMVFTGNPGTGKTTVARIVGRIYKGLGLLPKGQFVETDQSDLVAGYIGQTAVKTIEKLDEATGGVLFIDEAYALAASKENSFGMEAVNTLLKVMEDRRESLAVIVAGYTEPMRKFITSNPGLHSRFSRFVHFPDYEPAALLKIFQDLCARYGLALDAAALKAVTSHIGEMHRLRSRDFANAREVRKLFEEAVERQASRIMRDGAADPSAFTAEDFPQAGAATGNVDELLAALTAMPGLENVKAEVTKLVNYVRVQQQRREQGLKVPAPSLHLVFTGNPGTGKTTVARLIGRIYKGLGLLPKGHFVEADQSDLVAGYVGQTAIKTMEKLDEATGGVLFLDEAYALTEQKQNNYGMEAINTLLKVMEDRRESLAIVVAGYSEPMERFIHSNPGLKSRFTRFIDFPDYDQPTLFCIFENFCRQSDMRLDDGAREAVQGRIHCLLEAKDERFANGRAMRKLFEESMERLATRIAGQPGADSSLLLAEDVA